MIPAYALNNFSSVKLHLWGSLVYLVFCVEHCHKRPFFGHLNWYSWGVIFLPWKKALRNEYVIFLFLLTQNMWNPNVQIAHFFYLFQVATDWDVLRLSDNSRILLCGMYSNNSLEWRIARRKHWKPVSDFLIKTRNFQSRFCSFFVIIKLLQHYMSNIASSSSILGAWTID